MHILSDWIQTFFGQIMLLIFMICLFCKMADMRPEPVVSGLLEISRQGMIGVVALARAFIIGAFRLSLALLRTIGLALQNCRKQLPRK